MSPRKFPRPEVPRNPIHPRLILADEVVAIGSSNSALAKVLKIPTKRIAEIVNRKRGISADTALRLARHFGTSAELWMNLQTM
jgi:addiction module HigA family antidote